MLRNLGPQIQWLESYVTDQKIYCLYIAPNKEMVERHAKQSGFPADRISEVKSMIDPTSAEANRLQPDRVTRFETTCRHAFGRLPAWRPSIVRGQIGRRVKP